MQETSSIYLIYHLKNNKKLSFYLLNLPCKGRSSGFVPFFEQKLQGLSRTPFAFFKDSIQCKKEIWVYVFFSSTTTWAILSWRSFILGTWESRLDKVSTEIQGLSSTDYNFQGLSRPWTFYFKFQGLSRTFKVRANPGSFIATSTWPFHHIVSRKSKTLHAFLFLWTTISRRWNEISHMSFATIAVESES